MATLYTHAAVGLALARVYSGRRWPVMCWILAWFLPIVPDLDAFSNAPYGTALGHRGFTHSISFALAVGLIAAAATFRHFKASLWTTWALFFVITASHGILDAFTDGGEGVPLFWPLSDHRFGPWGPIHVSDIADQFPNPWQSRAIRTELLWVWLPMILLIGAVAVYRGSRRRGTELPS